MLGQRQERWMVNRSEVGQKNSPFSWWTSTCSAALAFTLSVGLIPVILLYSEFSVISGAGLSPWDSGRSCEFISYNPAPRSFSPFMLLCCRTCPLHWSAKSCPAAPVGSRGPKSFLLSVSHMFRGGGGGGVCISVVSSDSLNTNQSILLWMQGEARAWNELDDKSSKLNSLTLTEVSKQRRLSGSGRGLCPVPKSSYRWINLRNAGCSQWLDRESAHGSKAQHTWARSEVTVRTGTPTWVSHEGEQLPSFTGLSCTDLAAY